MFVAENYFFFCCLSYSTAVGQAVKECLDMWCSVDAEVSLKLTHFTSVEQ